MDKIREERKLGRDIIEAISDIQSCPQDNVKRFVVLKSRLVTLVARYRSTTGSETLLHKEAYYGYERVQRHGQS